MGQLLEKDRVQISTLGFPAVLKEVITIWIWNSISKLLAHGPGPEGQDPSVYQIVSFKRNTNTKLAFGFETTKLTNSICFKQ